MIAEITHLHPSGTLDRSITRWPASSLSLAQAMPDYVAALQPGGKLFYVSEALGYILTPVSARLRTRPGGQVVERWQRT